MSWHPIETAPKDGREILTCGVDEEGVPFMWVSCWWEHPDGTGHWTYWHDDSWASHWMPLPEWPDFIGDEIRLEEELDEIHRDLDFEDAFPFGMPDEE